MVTRTPAMVNPVVYDPRYGQFGELDARCDNYLGRGQFARINPGTGGKPKTMLAGKVLPAVKPCQPRRCKWGAQHCGRDWVRNQVYQVTMSLEPKPQ